MSLTLAARTQLAGAAAALNSLAHNSFAAAGVIVFADGSGSVPLTARLEVAITPGTVSSNRKAIVFAQLSLDGTNFGTGPVSGTTITDEPNLVPIGEVPLNSNATLQRAAFDLAPHFGGSIPYAARIVIKNESGAAFASSGNDVQYQFVNVEE